MTNYTKQVIRSATITLVMMVLTAGLGYVWRFVLARKLTIEEFGLFFAVFGFVNLFYGFKGLGLGSGVVRFITEFRLSNNPVGVKKIINSYIFIQVIVFGVLSLIMIFCADLLAQYYFKTEESFSLLLILATVFFFTIGIQTVQGLLLGYRRMIELSTVEFIQSLMLFIATLIFFYFGSSLLAPAYAYAVSFIITVGWCIFLLLRSFSFFKIRAPFFNKDSIIKLFGFGKYVFMGSVCYSIILNFGTITLTYFRTLPEVAIYSVAFSLANVIRFIPRAITITVLPLTSELEIQNKQKLLLGISKLYTFLIAGVLPLSLVLMLIPGIIIKILFGEKYLASAEPLQILAFSMTFTALYMVNQNILLGIKQPKEFGKIIVLGGTLTFFFSVLLTPFYGVIGTALAALFGAVFTAAYSIWRIWKLICPSIPWKNWILTFFAGILFATVSLFIQQINFFQSYILSGFSIIMGSIFYVFALHVFKVVSFSESMSLVRLLIKK